MQVNQPQGGAPKAITERTRPTMASHRLELPSICDICSKARSTRKHARCSQIRQQRKNAEWATYMENIRAKKAQGGRRYAR
ncbi:hypothetical protein D9M68_756300 [compost metagenome]